MANSQIRTTKWTPELIPDPLPPNIDPELVEPYYRKAGECIRVTAQRTHEAVCLDPTCPSAWLGPDAFPAASVHTSNTGHLTRLYYRAEYVMQINPLHPKHAGKVTHTVDHSAPDLPPHQAHLFKQGDTGREPMTARNRARAAERQAIAAEARASRYIPTQADL